MSHSIQIAVQKAGETIYVSESKADAQVYMNLCRASLERMLEEGCEIKGFTADIYETSASAGVYEATEEPGTTYSNGK